MNFFNKKSSPRRRIHDKASSNSTFFLRHSTSLISLNDEDKFINILESNSPYLAWKNSQHGFKPRALLPVLDAEESPKAEIPSPIRGQHVKPNTRINPEKRISKASINEKLIQSRAEKFVTEKNRDSKIEMEQGVKRIRSPLQILTPGLNSSDKMGLTPNAMGRRIYEKENKVSSTDKLSSQHWAKSDSDLLTSEGKQK